MRAFLPDGPPWGRPAVDAIPLPPFATTAEHDRFTRMLQLHVALADDGRPSLGAKTLCAALTPRGERSVQPTLLELRTAMATYFPAPWTPQALAASLAVLGDRSSPEAIPGGRWRWAYDPDFTATPKAGGGWEVERHERGGRSTQDLEHDGDLVLLWMEMYSERHAYPFGWRVEEGDMAALAAAARAARAAHATDAGYRYLENWRNERDAALG